MAELFEAKANMSAVFKLKRPSHRESICVMPNQFFEARLMLGYVRNGLRKIKHASFLPVSQLNTFDIGTVEWRLPCCVNGAEGTHFLIQWERKRKIVRKCLHNTGTSVVEVCREWETTQHKTNFGRARIQGYVKASRRKSVFSLPPLKINCVFLMMKPKEKKFVQRNEKERKF